MAMQPFDTMLMPSLRRLRSGDGCSLALPTPPGDIA
jgi:hypothetical protein